MTEAGSSSGKPSNPDNEVTVVKRAPMRPRSDEEKARRRFFGKFQKGNKKPKDPEDEDKPNKAPWYQRKGGRT
jgi:Ca2+:H+ antiporter